MLSSDDSPLPDTEVHHLRSEHVRDEFKILVGHSGASGAAPGQVLFMGDAWANFGTAVETIRLVAGAGDLPPLLVVAIGYRVATIEDNYPLRTRDFTPTADLTGARPGPPRWAAPAGF